VPVSFPSSLSAIKQPLTQLAEWAGVDLSEFPHLEKWLYKLLERPGFEAGRHVPTPHTAFETNKLTEEEIEAKAAASKAWIQAGMKDDAKK
jgi:glutathione S-transferase